MPATVTVNNPQRLKLILFTIALNVLAVIVFARMPWSDWRTGMVLNLTDNAILIGYAVFYRDAFLGRLIAFGLALGFTELIADAWLVDHTRTLDYSIGGGPMLWRSPLWMPFAWEVVAVQFAVLGLWLVERFKQTGLLLTGLIGAVNIPFYEEMALRTNWWAYQNCKMFLHTPYYIIVGEFFIVVAIVLLAGNIYKQNMIKSLISGVVGGIAIFACYKIPYCLIELNRL